MKLSDFTAGMGTFPPFSRGCTLAGQNVLSQSSFVASGWCSGVNIDEIRLYMDDRHDNGGRIDRDMDQIKSQHRWANQQQELERLVRERTRELAKTNKQLREQIEQRARATEKLRAYSKRLEEMNTAMRVLLDKHSEDRRRSEELIRLNIKELLDPYLERLGNSELRSHQRQLVDVIRENLEEVIGSTASAFSSKFFMFSPNELQVVNLIRTGKTTKEMALLLNLSTRTIEAYRTSIRKKLNLKHKKINLRTYLSSL
ncbi:MAG: LuxR C-terminal-related transcriptional regulator [Desulfobacteraceae bacterium]|jgi:DNA-binding CsgD family transcriptional regulator